MTVVQMLFEETIFVKMAARQKTMSVTCAVLYQSRDYLSGRNAFPQCHCTARELVNTPCHHFPPRLFRVLFDVFVLRMCVCALEPPSGQEDYCHGYQPCQVHKAKYYTNYQLQTLPHTTMSKLFCLRRPAHLESRKILLNTFFIYVLYNVLQMQMEVLIVLSMQTVDRENVSRFQIYRDIQIYNCVFSYKLLFNFFFNRIKTKT